MSELDNIIKNHALVHSDKMKDKIKLLMIQLIGEDENESFLTNLSVAEGLNAGPRNNLRAELRRKVELL